MGLGLAAAKELASRGANLTLVDFNEQSLTDAVKGIKMEFPSSKIVSVVGDASKQEDVQKYVDQAVKTFGRIDGSITTRGLRDVRHP
jgi:NAD(P)-dependent dehydrogenase (short-subunit alcohol dehydrogenase family)